MSQTPSAGDPVDRPPVTPEQLDLIREKFGATGRLVSPLPGYVLEWESGRVFAFGGPLAGPDGPVELRRSRPRGRPPRRADGSVELCRPPLPRGRPPRVWTADEEAMLGTASDRVIARCLGAHKTTIAKRRRALGVRPWRESRKVDPALAE